MAFVNERVSDEDTEKYNLLSVWEKYENYEKEELVFCAKTHPFDWVIDRERILFNLFCKNHR